MMKTQGQMDLCKQHKEYKKDEHQTQSITLAAEAMKHAATVWSEEIICVAKLARSAVSKDMDDQKAETLAKALEIIQGKAEAIRDDIEYFSHKTH